ncbi:LysR family transcriptional regulator [Alteromonas sp. C1M14]|uniref:LysR family transcriptional regulator n=1 Tax=Alteromonas sp. C1M14 TaxID=2841567 RepID=UPI001C08DE93|nr:LysR family transcriptional regulator [Alteromonas sp. C1M14]MBU2977993.1 LysR family transcriptional regulator [Alteromonas sp. C1M14]
MLERHHLKIIAAIDEHGTLTEAAEKMHLTQSALSHSMRKLEQSLGTPLWQKEGRRLRLTHAGTTVLNLAQRVLPQIEHTEEQLYEIADGKQGALRIGMECHPCYQWLLRVVRPFLLSYPGVDVDVRQKFTFGGLQALHGYDIDLLLTPDPLHLPSVVYQAVFDYEQVLVMSHSHPLAGKAWVSPEDLRSEVLFTYPVEPSRLDIFSHFLTPAGCGVKRHKCIETTEILLQMVSAGRGVGALPRWLVEEQDTELALTTARLGKEGLAKSLHLGYRKTDANAPFVRAFIDMALKLGHTGP